jgi:hypothetical protein
MLHREFMDPKIPNSWRASVIGVIGIYSHFSPMDISWQPLALATASLQSFCLAIKSDCPARPPVHHGLPTEQNSSLTLYISGGMGVERVCCRSEGRDQYQPGWTQPGAN